MTDPLRRDPTEFLRTLKLMSQYSSWQKSLLFASRGRIIGFKLDIVHYNSILFSQCLWGRALEIVRTVRAMEEDNVRPNGVSYYYICNGMANADHGINYGHNMNMKLEGLQHWRVALSAYQAAEANGFDPSDNMLNSCIITCSIPVMNQWQVACRLFKKMVVEERQAHPQMVEFLNQCLVRNMRPREAGALLRYADENGVKGYEGKGVPDVYGALDERNREMMATMQLEERGEPKSSATSTSSSSLDSDAAAAVDAETMKNLQEEAELEALTPGTVNGTPKEAQKPFRPRVYRGLWYKWHGIANRYRPKESLSRRSIAPRNSPTGIPGFSRI